MKGGSNGEVFEASGGKKKINLLQSAYLFHCSLGGSIHRIALSYCRNKVPKAILKEESRRKSLLIQHSAHLCKNSPRLLNNSWLPVNFEQEKSLTLLLPKRKSRRRAGFSISLFTFSNPGARMGSEYECSGPKHLPLKQQELCAQIVRSHTQGL